MNSPDEIKVDTVGVRFYCKKTRVEQWVGTVAVYPTVEEQVRVTLICKECGEHHNLILRKGYFYDA